MNALCEEPSNLQMWVDAIRLGVIAFLASQATYQTVARPLGEVVRNGHSQDEKSIRE